MTNVQHGELIDREKDTKQLATTAAEKDLAVVIDKKIIYKNHVEKVITR